MAIRYSKVTIIVEDDESITTLIIPTAYTPHMEYEYDYNASNFPGYNYNAGTPVLERIKFSCRPLPTDADDLYTVERVDKESDEN